MAFNWGNIGAGALSGAGTGATIGSGIPGVGTAIGAGVGGLLGGAAGLFGSSGAKNDRFKKYATGIPEQEALHKNILARAMGMAEGGGADLANYFYNRFLGADQQKAFEQFAAPYLQQFQEQMLPQIAERFAGKGALSSSGFGQSLGGAAAGLQSQLAALFSQLQSEAAGKQYGQANQLAQTGLNYDPFAYAKQKGSHGFGGPFAAGVSENMEGILNGILSLFKNKGGSSAKQALGMGPAGLYPTEGNYNPFTDEIT